MDLLGVLNGSNNFSLDHSLPDYNTELVFILSTKRVYINKKIKCAKKERKT